MKYKVCITTAGIGSRLNKLTTHYNKALITVDNQPVISNIINSFNKNITFVIAIGFLGDQVKSYLELAHPKNKFIFIKVKKFQGSGSSLGHTLLCCQKKLNDPFIYVACDSFFNGTLDEPNHNWMGYSIDKVTSEFRSIDNNNETVQSINEKNKHLKNSKIYVGIAGIYDYKIFWKSMNENNKLSLQTGEVHGLKGILAKKTIYSKKIAWNDIGNIESLKRIRNKNKSKNNYNILTKEKEAIWFVNDYVIKQSVDQKFIEERVKRSKILKNYVPKIIEKNKHMYKYKKIEGMIFSDVNDINKFKRLLIFSKKFWQIKKLTIKEKVKFKKQCKIFYKNKSYDRVDLFLKKFNEIDRVKYINGIKNIPINELLNSIDWNELSNGIPTRMHGDFHFENILITSSNKFIFLDWRQNFAGELHYGDVYYDLAKLMHGLIVSHKIITKGLFEVNIKNNSAFFELNRYESNLDYEIFFKIWLKENNYDIQKVYLLTALIFLNIAILRHHPYSDLLFLLGKKMLIKILYDKKINK